MRKTTTPAVILGLATLMRVLATGHPMQGLLVPCMALWHEAQASYRGKSNKVSLLTIFLWAVRPEVYAFWTLMWVVLEYERTTTQVIKTKNKDDKKVIHHSNRLFPRSIIDHSFWDLGALCKMELIGSSLEMDYIGDVDPAMPVMDEITVLQTLGQIQQDAGKAWAVTRGILLAMTMVIAVFLGGYHGAMIGAIISFGIIITDPPKDHSEEKSPVVDPISISKTSKINCSDGIYRLSVRVFDYPIHRGVGYVKEGVLHTRYHVTGGNNIEYGDTEYPVAYANKITDNVSYGGIPKFSQIGIREEVVVAVAGPYSRCIMSYKTRAQMDDDGNVYFYGNRSMPGCSGSPVFKIDNTIVRNEESEALIQTYSLVGTIGWFYDRPSRDSSGNEDARHATEIMATEPMASGFHHNFMDKHVVQIFKHPGSGKTRTVARELIVDGLAKYGRVYFTGPTNVVCSEAYKALSEFFPNQVALLTSAATIAEKGSIHRPIVITAHATALAMLAKGNIDLTRRGLWIMDESHFVDSKTMILKDLLRYRTMKERNGALVEMTATGYDIYAKEYVVMEASNFPINDVTLEEDDMVDRILQLGVDRKCLVFVPSMRGKNKYSGETIASKAQRLGIKYIFLSRSTFNASYVKARDMTKGVVFTTDISECGANIHPDVVFDFQRSSKMVVVSGSVYLEKRIIDQGQQVQRRGRVGRKETGYPATYVSPGYNLMVADMNRVEHHERMAAAKGLGIDILDPTPSACWLNVTLTPQQISTWASGGEHGVEGMPLIAMITDGDGRPLPPDTVLHRIKEWLDSDNNVVLIGDKRVECDWWDERDRCKLEQFVMKSGKIPHLPVQESRKTLYSYLESIVGSASRRRVRDGLGNLIDNTENDEDEDDDDDHEADEYAKEEKYEEARASEIV